MRGTVSLSFLLTLEVGSYNPELSCAGLVEDGFSWDRFRLDLLRWSTGRSSTWAPQFAVPDLTPAALQRAAEAKAGSGCPLGYLALMRLQELFLPWGRPRSTILALTKYVAQRATLADVMWSSWPLPFLLSQVSKVLCRFVGSRHLVGFAKPRVAAYGRCWKARPKIWCLACCAPPHTALHQ